MPNKEVIEKRKKAAENMAVRSRNYRRARERALTALARKYKEDYLELLALEKEKDEQEGKRWRNIAGNSVLTDLNLPTNNTSTTRGVTSVDTQDESDDE